MVERFELLRQRCKDVPGVSCYNMSSVGVDEVESEELLRKFRGAFPNTASIADLLKCRAFELGYIADHHLETNGIEKIKRENGLENFDLVLLDGSELAGRAELNAVYGSNIIALDDVLVLKNSFNLMRLTYDDQYELIESDAKLRNGYAIFRKRKAS